MKGAYKTLKKSDVQVFPYPANKSWITNHLTYGELGIKIFIGQNLTGSFFLNKTLTTDSASGNTQYSKLVYESIKQLYYSNYLTGSILQNTSSADNYEQTTIRIGIDDLQSGSYETIYKGPVKIFPTGSNQHIRVLSIPNEIYGSKIVPGTINLYGDDYNIIDDNEGNLYDDFYGDWINVGNIIYSHGMVVITNQSYLKIFPTSSSDTITTSATPQRSGSFTLEFKGEHIIHEHVITCHANEDEFNYTNNPSVTTDNEGELYGFATGSDFNPYVTTVGVFNEANELLLVAKLGKPIPMPRNSDITFKINYDS